MIDFRNINTVWASVLAETFYRLGLKTVITCPGSRSTPLTVAFAQHSDLETIPILDERSAAFFALGITKSSGLPTILVCTSGTAGANFYPAIIEASESRIPLIILTADRPPELRHCHAGQTIDQVKLYGNYPRWQTELALPSIELEQLSYLRQTIIYSWERSQFPIPGVIHLNLPFRDPLHPVYQPKIATLKTHFPQTFFDAVKVEPSSPQNVSIQSHLNSWKNLQKGIIIAGVAQPKNPQTYCQSIADLAQQLNWPVLAEALSPVRNFAEINPFIISSYDQILRYQNIAQTLIPQQVIQIGDLPTSKTLRSWLQSLQVPTLILDESYQNLDALHLPSQHLRISIQQFFKQLQTQPKINQNSQYLEKWSHLNQTVKQDLNLKMSNINQLIEPKVTWLLSQSLPKNTPLWIANSMPVRDLEFFWLPNDLQIQPHFNRGANGIDGTLSTALGMAYHNQSSVLLTGDLALLHDSNGGLIQPKFKGHLTIILINNQGGGIFEMLPISEFDPPFEDFFATPQQIDFSQWCQTYHIQYEKIQSWQQLQQRLNPLPNSGIRLLEVPTNRKRDTEWRQQYFAEMVNLT